MFDKEETEDLAEIDYHEETLWQLMEDDSEDEDFEND